MFQLNSRFLSSDCEFATKDISHGFLIYSKYPHSVMETFSHSVLYLCSMFVFVLCTQSTGILLIEKNVYFQHSSVFSVLLVLDSYRILNSLFATFINIFVYADYGRPLMAI